MLGNSPVSASAIEERCAAGCYRRRVRPFLLLLCSSFLLAPATRAEPLDPIGLPTTAAGGALAGGLLGSGVALSLAFAAERATGDEVTPEARSLNQLATFGTLAMPALLSVVGAAVGGGISGDLVGALTAGFGATVGAAVGTGLALVVVPLTPGDPDTGSPLVSTAAVAGLVVGGATLGAAVAGVIAALTVEPAALDSDVDDPGDPFADGDVDRAFDGPPADDASGSD